MIVERYKWVSACKPCNPPSSFTYVCIRWDGLTDSQLTPTLSHSLRLVWVGGWSIWRPLKTTLFLITIRFLAIIYFFHSFLIRFGGVVLFIYIPLSSIHYFFYISHKIMLAFHTLILQYIRLEWLLVIFRQCSCTTLLLHYFNFHGVFFWGVCKGQKYVLIDWTIRVNNEYVIIISPCIA